MTILYNFVIYLGCVGSSLLLGLFSSCGYRASLVSEHGLQSTGSIVVAHVGPSQIRDQTCVSHVSRQILYP